MMLERDLEKRFIRMAKQFQCLCYKWHSRTTKGVPDRILILPTGEIYFVELKTSLGKLSKWQEIIATELISYNTNYICLHGKDEIDTFFREVVCPLRVL
jgi:hypothetical protein